jgi:hypothetical protein
MIRKWLRPSSHSMPVLFMLAGLFGGLFAWNSFNLIHLAMANVQFLEMFGATAINEGGLRQLIEIAAYAAMSLVFYMAFKVCEVEIVHRWRSSREP